MAGRSTKRAPRSSAGGARGKERRLAGSLRRFDRAVGRLRARAEHDPAVADALEAFAARPDPDIEPLGDVSDTELQLAAQVVSARRARARDDLARRALTTPEVVDLLGYADRRGVDALRRRGGLLGVRHGQGYLHPAWQFDLAGRSRREGLERILASLAEVTGTAASQDAVMAVERDELGGRSIADLFGDGDVDGAVRTIVMSGDQS